MGYVYIAALILGLGTVLMQFLLSHMGGADHDMDGGGHDMDGDGHADAGGDHSGAIGSAAALFLSMRFWTFAFMGFGLIGTALHYAQLAGSILTPALSIVFGLVSGLGAALAFRSLKQGVSSSESSADAVGQVGRMLVASGGEHMGKVRLQLKGKTLDVIATSDAPLQEGDQVLVVEVRGTNAHVEPYPGEPQRSRN